ncbi:MAG: Stk1 family PASTA domain-containing Ser/Thr kinase [Lysinibacillus sp.]
MIVGKRISDRYKIIELIGGGGMSNVYLAHDIILNRDVAIKILRYDFTNEEELHRRFQREALSATSLTHPNIVSIYDVGDDGDLHYIVMEYVRGKTLKQYIQEFTPISPARSVHIMRQLISAIADAHENHIIHRDIKPQNILLDEEGNVKITDFGIAMTLSATSFTQTNSVLGTVHYLSPEQARGGTATNKSDIYALGIVLYELLTGELPFSGESAVSIALKHLQSETPSVRAFDATIPQSIENVVLKATAKDPAHRYANVEEMQADLDSALSLNRMNEQKFQVPIDNDATRAMPVIKDPVQHAKSDLFQTRQLEATPKMETPKAQVVQKSKKGKPKKKWPKIVGGILASIVLLFLVLFFATDMFKPDKIEVPTVTGLTTEEAQRKIEEMGFVVGKRTDQFDEEVEEDKVIETHPTAGTERPKGAEIDIVVSKGIEKSKMSNYTGLKLTQAQSMLEDSEFLPIKVIEKYSDDEQGTIIEQKPQMGEEVDPKNTVIEFTVSLGKKMMTLANVVGYSEAALNDYARLNGWSIQVVGHENSDTISVGNVISQKPSKGTKLEGGESIKVVLSKGPEVKPEIFHLPVVIPYEPTEPFEEGVEQTVQIFIEDKTHSIKDVFKEFTIKSDTTYSIPFNLIKGEKGNYKIVRDSKIIEADSVSF